MKNALFVGIGLLVASAGTASAHQPFPIFGWGGPQLNRYVSGQFRQVSPWGYQAALYSARSIPPQVRNQMGNPYRAYSPYQEELRRARLVPPEVRNSARNNYVPQQVPYQVIYPQPVAPQVVIPQVVAPAVIDSQATQHQQLVPVITAPPVTTPLPKVLQR